MQLLTVVGARPPVHQGGGREPGHCRDPRHRATDHGADPAHRPAFRCGDVGSVLFELGIPEPAFHLGIGGGSHGVNTGRMLEAIERVLLAECPDAVLVWRHRFHPR